MSHTDVETPDGKYIGTVKVGEKGQFVIPKEARDLFNISPGDTLIVLGDKKRGIALLPQNAFTKITKMALSDIFTEEE